MEIEIQLTDTPIAAYLSAPTSGVGAGAWVEFRGVVRGEENGGVIAALEYEAYLFGHSIENGVMTAAKDDVPPYFAVMFQADKRNGKTRFTKFYKVQFTEPSQSGNTKEENIKYDTPTITAKAIYRLSDGRSYTKADEESTGFAADTAASWYQSV